MSDGTIKYRPKITYFFRQDLSYGSEHDNVTLLNVPFVVSIRLLNIYFLQVSSNVYPSIELIYYLGGRKDGMGNLETTLNTLHFR